MRVVYSSALRAGTTKFCVAWRVLGWRFDPCHGWLPVYAPEPVVFFPA